MLFRSPDDRLALVERADMRCEIFIPGLTDAGGERVEARSSCDCEVWTHAMFSDLIPEFLTYVARTKTCLNSRVIAPGIPSVSQRRRNEKTPTRPRILAVVASPFWEAKRDSEGFLLREDDRLASSPSPVDVLHAIVSRERKQGGTERAG